MAESGAVADGQSISRVIFLPGMAARPAMWASVAKRVEAEPFQVEIWEWITPVGNETIEQYAARWIERHRGEAGGRTIVVGASFGGIVGQQVAKLLDADALVLVGSVKTRSELPVWMRMLSPMRWLAGLVPWRVVQLGVDQTRGIWRPFVGKDLGLVMEEFVVADAKLIGWSIKRMLAWKGEGDLLCPVTTIHGTKDRLLPMDMNQVDVVIPDGGHVLSVSHAEEIADVLERLVLLVRDF
ncbi:alpha/beta fold hydrolase [Lacunimicrobium album]